MPGDQHVEPGLQDVDRLHERAVDPVGVALGLVHQATDDEEGVALERALIACDLLAGVEALIGRADVAGDLAHRMVAALEGADANEVAGVLDYDGELLARGLLVVALVVA